jgi:hypothetical protein
MASLEAQLRASVQMIQLRKAKQVSEAIVKAENGNAGKDVAALVEQVVIRGDLSGLSPTEKSQYYSAVCDSIGLNPLTRPLEYLKLNGKEVLYARKDCTDQLRSKHSVSVKLAAKERVDDVYIVTATATMPSGRTDESTGAVTIGNLKGDNLANALMKAETKAKRRVTLSICGLGFLDETELETIPALITQLPRISPHGEPAPGVVPLTGEYADEIVLAIEAAETKEELQTAWSGDLDVYERFGELDRKRIGYAAQRKMRQLAKPARELDQAAAAATASEEDL